LHTKNTLLLLEGANYYLGNEKKKTAHSSSIIFNGSAEEIAVNLAACEIDYLFLFREK